jgi:HK97 family phage major capsid protein
MEFNEEVLNVVSGVLQEKYGFATTSQLDKAVTEIMRRTIENKTRNGNTFSISTMIRGLRAMRGEPIKAETAESDVAYVKALTTGSTPGSYVVPTVQSQEIIEYLTLGGVARSSGVRIWDMNGIQKMNVVSALATPTWVWMAQNSVQTPTDPNLGQLAFDLKERRCLVAVPNQLLAVSVPGFDTLLSQLIGAGAAEHEDNTLFATSTVSGGFTALQSAANISSINTGNSGNGGNLAFTDVLAVLAKASAVKAKGPFVWYASPRTFWQRVYGMIDTQSRPLFIPTLTQGLVQGAAGVGQMPVGNLMGYPVYVTPELSETQALGSGTNQATLIFTNPKYIHIAQDGNISIAYSTERFFDANQTAIRAVQEEDAGYAPPAGIVVLKGIN